MWKFQACAENSFWVVISQTWVTRSSSLSQPGKCRLLIGQFWTHPQPLVYKGADFCLWSIHSADFLEVRPPLSDHSLIPRNSTRVCFTDAPSLLAVSALAWHWCDTDLLCVVHWVVYLTLVYVSMCHSVYVSSWQSVLVIWNKKRKLYKTSIRLVFGVLHHTHLILVGLGGSPDTSKG